MSGIMVYEERVRAKLCEAFLGEIARLRTALAEKTEGIDQAIAIGQHWERCYQVASAALAEAERERDRLRAEVNAKAQRVPVPVPVPNHTSFAYPTVSTKANSSDVDVA